LWIVPFSNILFQLYFDAVEVLPEKDRNVKTDSLNSRRSAGQAIVLGSEACGQLESLKLFTVGAGISSFLFPSLLSLSLSFPPQLERLKILFLLSSPRLFKAGEGGDCD
jgi:hypothetical protein